MKKISVAILAIVYLTVSSGVAMTIHYCMGKFSSVDIASHSDKCGKCGMKTKDGCCKDEFKIYKLNDSHKLINNEIKIAAPVAIINNIKSSFDSKINRIASVSEFNSHSPPERQDISLSILNCVFRI